MYNYPLAYAVINEESINMRLYQTSIRFCLQKEEDSNQSGTWKEEEILLGCGCGVYGLNFEIEKAGLSRGSRDQH